MVNLIKNYSIWFCVLCIILFIIQIIIPGFTELFMLTPDALSQPWQFLTAVFLHGGIAHLLYNLFALFLFGFMLEHLVGSKKFFWLFLISGILANLISFIIYPNQNALGASGAIMAVIGVLAVLKPMMTVWAFNLPMPMFIAAVLWAGGSVMGIFGFGDQGVGHLAHLSGIFIGIFYGFYLRFRYSKHVYRADSHKIIIDENSMRNWEDYNLR